mmetsp:Transcript_49940/g.128523  ORF Transcript_49940/g.128523 Transcript_49940/m.128523 type:complete len:109 (+) Transcript_49940:1300-1626(+)
MFLSAFLSSSLRACFHLDNRTVWSVVWCRPLLIELHTTLKPPSSSFCESSIHQPTPLTHLHTQLLTHTHVHIRMHAHIVHHITPSSLLHVDTEVPPLFAFTFVQKCTQ